MTEALIHDITGDEHFVVEAPSRTMKPKRAYAPGPQDVCETPGYALDPLIPYLNVVWDIWEPACGRGRMVRGLEMRHMTAFGTDLDQGIDFFDTIPDRPFEAIVTNPPYSIKPKWIARCYQIGKPFALLLPVETIGSKAVQTLMQTYGVEILLLNRRVNFYMPHKGFSGKGAQFPVLWYCWKLLPQPICYGEIISYDEPEDVL